MPAIKPDFAVRFEYMPVYVEVEVLLPISMKSRKKQFGGEFVE